MVGVRAFSARGGRGAGLADSLEAAAGGHPSQELEVGCHLAAAIRAGGARAAFAVAAGHPGRRAQAAAEYYRGAGGRFAEHGHRGHRRDAGSAGHQGARRRRARPAAKEISDSHLPAGPANLARAKARRPENFASCFRDAHRRRPQAAGRRGRRFADRRGSAPQRRRGQFRRDRSRYDFHVSQPQDSGAHGRLRPGTNGARRGDQRRRRSRRARSPIRASPPK